MKKTLLLDSTAASMDSEKPAFLAPPADAPAYYGFPLIPETTIDGFTLGAVTDYLESDCELGCSVGDAFVEAPDGTRAGLVWWVDTDHRYAVLSRPDERRWGVYFFTVTKPIRDVDGLREMFSHVLPVLARFHAGQAGSTPSIG